jgi:uncharacterized membrane protein
VSFCSSCGSPLNEATALCGSCGAAVAVAGAPSAFIAPASQAGAGVSSKTAAALAYLLTAVTGLYFLLAEPYRRDRYVRFHALQAILFYLAAAGLWTAYWVGSSLLRFISFGFSIWITFFVSLLLALAMVGYWLFLMYKAYQGESYKIPRLGEIAESAAQPDELPPGVAGFLTYCLAFITGIIFLLTGRYKRDSFVRFHAFQSIFASIAYVVIVIFWSVLMGALFFATLGTIWEALVLALLAFRAAACAGWFYLMYEAYQGKRTAIPGIGGLAAKQAG